jgi:hypothetical protein
VKAHLATQNLGDYSHLLAALGESTKVDQARGDYLASRNRGDSGDWHKHATASADFNQHAGCLWSARFTVGDKNVDDFSYAVSRWVKDATSSQSGYKDSRCAHPSTLDECARPCQNGQVNKTVRSQSRNNPPALPQGEVIAKFTNYAEAVAFVDGIIANGFPAGAVAIVGKDLRTVERVRGKMSYGRVAVSGAVTGSWIGLFAGFVFGGSSATSAVTTTTSAFGSTFSTVLIGAGLGMLVNILRYSLMRNKRAFVSQSTVIASKYEVQVPSALADQASAAAAKSEG